MDTAIAELFYDCSVFTR